MSPTIAVYAALSIQTHLYFQGSRNSAGIIAGIPPAFHWNSSRNSAGIIAGIPPEFCWNCYRYTAGIPDNSSWNSTGIPGPNTAGIPEFR